MFVLWGFTYAPAFAVSRLQLSNISPKLQLTFPKAQVKRSRMGTQDHAFSPLVDSDLNDAEEKFAQIHERHHKAHLFAHKTGKPLLLQLSFLILGLLNIGFLGVLLLRTPTDRECAAHTSVWCESPYQFHLNSKCLCRLTQV